MATEYTDNDGAKSSLAKKKIMQQWRMRRVRWLALAVSLILVSSFWHPFVPLTRAQDAAGLDTWTDEKQQIFDALNAKRTAAGLVALAADPLLGQAAQAHAEDILYNRNYSHWGSDGSLAEDRVARTGYAANPWVSENWVSSSNPASAMSWWMNDYIHRVNILTPRWREVGIGVAINYETGEMIFVTVFSPGRSTEALVATAAASVAVEPDGAPDQARAVTPGQHTVQPGDTLLAIALRYGHDVGDIAAVNGMDEDRLLQIGQVLYMPGDEDGSGTSLGGIGGPESVPSETYTVAAGDTLFSIAAAHDMTWQELARMNGLAESALLQIGQEVQVPLSGEQSDPAGDVALEAEAGDGASLNESHSQDAPGSTAEDPLSSGAGSILGDESAGESSSSIQYHVIGEGDTVIDIAQHYGVAWGELLELNGLDDDSILQPGKVLRLR